METEYNEVQRCEEGIVLYKSNHTKEERHINYKNVFKKLLNDYRSMSKEQREENALKFIKECDHIIRRELIVNIKRGETLISSDIFNHTPNFSFNRFIRTMNADEREVLINFIEEKYGVEILRKKYSNEFKIIVNQGRL